MSPGPEISTIRARDAADGDLPAEFRRTVKRADRLLVLSDFDGTLSDIVDEPDAATIRPDAREALSWLADSDATDVAVVSGRARTDVEDRVGVQAAWYAGNHGLEIATDNETFVHPTAEGTSGAIRDCCAVVRDELDGLDGVVVEDKGLTATIHYRMIDDDSDIERVQRAVRSAVEDVDGDALRVTDGKQILETRPDVDWDKGRAVEWITDTAYDAGDQPCRMYIGDDVSDEAAFRSLESDEIAIRVGSDSEETDADYRVSDPTVVTALLAQVAALRAG